MLEPNAIFQTIDRGVQEGIFVASVVRPDKSVRTIWREPIDLALRNDPALELFLPQKATLSVVPWRELTKGVLPELWSGDTLSIGDAIAYFAGGRTVTIDRGGFAESMGVPAAAAPAVEAAVAEAVRRGVLWLVNGPASFQSEDVPPAALSANAILRAPHPVIPYDRLLPDHLPAAWKDGAATALSISLALSNAENTPLPWSIVRQSIEDAVKMRWLALADESSTWPCDYAGAASVVFRLPDAQNRSTTTTVSDKETRPKGAYTGAAVLAGSALQDFVDVLPDFMKSVAGTKLRFRLEITLGDGEDIEPQKIATLNELLESVSKELALKR